MPWRAIDQRGAVLDILVQERRDAMAAERFFRRLLGGLRSKPRRLVTDGLRSYGMARATRLTLPRAGQSSPARAFLACARGASTAA